MQPKKQIDIGEGPKVQCNGIVPESGERCKRMTFDSSGFCQLHRDQFTIESEYGILKCRNCQVRDCNQRDKAPRGMCYFELYDDTRDFDTRDKTLKAMREVLRNEYTMKNRIERELSRVNLELIGTDEGERIQILFGMYQSVCNSISAHLERFGKFQGYEASENEDEATKKKMATVERILTANRKKRQVERDTEKLIEVVVKE